MRGQKISLRNYENNVVRNSSSLDEEEDEEEIKFLLEKERQRAEAEDLYVCKKNGKWEKRKKKIKKISDVPIQIGKYLFFPDENGNLDISSSFKNHTAKFKNPFDNKSNKHLDNVNLKNKNNYKINYLKIKNSTDKNKLYNIIFNIIKNYGKPTHINYIIDKLSKKKLLNDQNLHSYSRVYSTISKHYELFERVAPGTFYIRSAFLENKTNNVVPKIKPIKNNNIYSLNFLIKELVKSISPKNLTSNPLEVFNELKKFNFTGTYDNVYQAMQSNDWTRRHNSYKLKQAIKKIIKGKSNAKPKSAKQSQTK